MISLIILFILIAILIAIFLAKKENKKYQYICNQKYALCTSASCLPDPTDKTKTICSCDIQEGKNMSTIPCDKLRPHGDKLYSTFSLNQFIAGKKGMTCPKTDSWSSCLNKPCVVDASDKTKAICHCDLMKTNNEWETAGGNCDKTTCSTSLWSGATSSDAKQARDFMLYHQGFDKKQIQVC